jgi:hypothetical protein
VEETPGPRKADYSKNSLACYLNETRRFCLLSVIEERELGRVLDLEKYFNLLEAEYTATYGVQPLAIDICLILLKSFLRDYPLFEELCGRVDLNSLIPIFYYEWTLKKVSTRLGITRERVRQIQNIALNTLRNPDISRNLKDYL